LGATRAVAKQTGDDYRIASQRLFAKISSMPERRYTDDEVAEILARASEKEQAARTQLQPAEGMTLGELQKIASEAGIAPDLVAQAARSLDEPAPPTPPAFLGLPLGAARTVRLERRMSDTEWEQLVVRLRETFNARGVIRNEGSFRSWSNGNLQCLVEPDGEGQRVRFRTVRGNARPTMIFGLGALGGAAMFLIGAFPLPRWARLRQRQMDELAEQLTAPSP
jgi:hypothetical protein